VLHTAPPRFLAAGQRTNSKLSSRALIEPLGRGSSLKGPALAAYPDQISRWCLCRSALKMGDDSRMAGTKIVSRRDVEVLADRLRARADGPKIREPLDPRADLLLTGMLLRKWLRDGTIPDGPFRLVEPLD
jgi:hypothetical protein